MKRFLVFAGDTYYPAGGWDDFYGQYDTEEEAKAKAKELDEQRKFDWQQVIDTEQVTGL